MSACRQGKLRKNECTSTLTLQDFPLPSQSKEDEELERAIQDSLMTASFHSASALQEEVKAVRADDVDMPLNWAQFVHFGA